MTRKQANVAHRINAVIQRPDRAAYEFVWDSVVITFLRIRRNHKMKSGECLEEKRQTCRQVRGSDQSRLESRRRESREGSKLSGHMCLIAITRREGNLRRGSLFAQRLSGEAKPHDPCEELRPNAQMLGECAFELPRMCVE